MVGLIDTNEGRVCTMKMDKLMKNFEEKKEEFYKEWLENEEQELKKKRERSEQERDDE